MPSDIFVISSACDRDIPTSLRRAVELAGVASTSLQDVVFGLDASETYPDPDAIRRAAGLTCPTVAVLSGMRALFFAAASILADDAHLVLVAGLNSDTCAALVLASPEAVGRLNLLPRARLASRSLVGPDAALRVAGLAPADVEITRHGQHAALLLHELLDDLESQSARWGLLSVSGAALVVERI